MEFVPLFLEHQRELKNFFKLDPPRISELTFTNLFIWRHKYEPMWSVWNNFLFILIKDERGSYVGLPPVGTGNKAVALGKLFREVAEVSPNPQVCRAEQIFVENFVDSKKYTIFEDRDNRDYVYFTDHLIRLAGNNYRSHRNLINKFKRRYLYEYKIIDDAVLNSCLQVQTKWCAAKQCEANSDLLLEDGAVQEALLNFRSLGLNGGAIFIDSHVEAFTLGELLNPETAVIHVEKSNPDLPGLNAAVNQHVCANNWPQTKYVNQEQDLGIEGLRRAKLLYRPAFLVQKFTIGMK
jgi:hypothetical protein